MPQVFVFGVVGLPGDFQGDVVGLGVVDFLVAALDVPLPPGGDDLHVRVKVHDGQLKPDLVVALAGAAVADRVGPLGLGDLHHPLGQHRPGKAGAQQVALIVGAGLHGGDDVVVHKFVGQILDVQLAGPRGLGPGFQPVQLAGLADVAADGDDFAVVVVLFQPGDDDGGVQAAGIGQDHFFDFRHGDPLLLFCLCLSSGLIILSLLKYVKIIVVIVMITKGYVRRRADERQL